MTLAAAVAVALTALAGTAQASGRGFTGVVNPFLARCLDPKQNGDCLSNDDVRRMHSAHITIVRWGFRWNQVEGTNRTYNWAGTDATIGALANRGMRVLPVVTGTPSWAGATFETPPLATRRARQGWRRFLKKAVKRYGPGGDYWRKPSLYRHAYPKGKARPIHAWQIWNEQNIYNPNNPRSQYMEPRKYRKLVRMAHNSVVRADPKARIVLGGMPGYTHPRAWVYLKKLYKQRKFKREFDAVALHPYSPDVSHVLIQVRRMRHVMKQQGDADTPLWITELGWGSAPPSQAAQINKGPEGQKRLLRKTFPRLKRHRHQWHLQHAFWFRWRDPPKGKGGCTFCGSSGLFWHNEKPKPSWTAFKQVTKPRR